MKSILQQTKIVALGIIVAVGISYAFAWTGPTSTPPSGNVSSPINVGSTTQTKYGSLVLNGLSVNAATILSGALQIPIGTPTAGAVLTAQDASGTVAWVAAGGSASSSGGTVFITPTTLATVSSGVTVGWTTVSLASAGVPSTASAVLLEAKGNSYNQPSAEIDVRANSSSPTYQLLLMGTSQYSSNTANGQGIFPVSVSGGNASIQYQVPSAFGGSGGQGSFTIVGYVTGSGTGGSTFSSLGVTPNVVTNIVAGTNVSISPSGGTGAVTITGPSSVVNSGAVTGGWYGYTGAIYNNNFQTIWGNATLTNRDAAYGGINYTPSCPSGYSVISTDNKYPSSGYTSIPKEAFCIAN
jgi:hypothetical protein